MSYRTSDQHYLFCIYGTMVFSAVCLHDRCHPHDVYGNPAVSADRCRIWRLYFRCILPGIQRKNHLRCTWRDLWNRHHRFPGILSGHGLFDGKRRTERILLYADVYFRYDHGRNCRIHLSEGVKPDRNACEISGKSGSKSL